SQLAVLGNVTSYKDTGLSAGSKCYYEVAATNGAGTSAFSNVANATTTATQSPPAAPSNLTAGAVSTNEIDLTWTNNASNANGFVVNRSSDGVTFSQLAVLGNVTSYKDTGLSAGSKCYYEVAATNGAGTSAFSNMANATTTAAQSPPAAPSNLTAGAVSTSEIDLTWTNNASNASGFVVNRSTDGVTFSQLAVLGNVTSYKDTGLSAGSKCYYEVAATNGAGTSAFSNVANATTTAAQSPPAAPSNLTAGAVSTSEIDLTWTNNASNASGFVVNRSTDGVTFSQLAVLGNVTSYKDTGL